MRTFVVRVFSRVDVVVEADTNQAAAVEAARTVSVALEKVGGNVVLEDFELKDAQPAMTRGH